MMNKKEITKFAKAVIHSQKGLKNKQLMHPKREWLIGVGVALCIFIASISWSAVEYFKYETIEQQATSPSAAADAVYRETLVSEALSTYANKAVHLDALLGENVPVIPTDNTDKEDESEEEMVGTESSEDGVVATTTQATSSRGSNIQPPIENEESAAVATTSESSAAPIEERLVQPATNI